jgi:hypothetical protein
MHKPTHKSGMVGSQCIQVTSSDCRRRHLTRAQQSNYLNAVKCLMSKPAQGSEYFPVKSRFDDFPAVHINATGPLSTLPMRKPLFNDCMC